MLATLEIVVGMVFLLLTIVSFWAALPGKPLNGWLLKHSAAEAMFPLFIMATLLISASAFVVPFHLPQIALPKSPKVKKRISGGRGNALKIIWRFKYLSR